MPKYHACLSVEFHPNVEADDPDEAAVCAVGLLALPRTATVNVDDLQPLDDDADLDDEGDLTHLALTDHSIDVVLSALEQAADTRPDFENEAIARILCDKAGRPVPAWANRTEERP